MNMTSNNGRIVIANSVPGIEELHKYSKGILYLLSKIKIDHSNPEFKAHLKSVYELLGHLQPDDDFLTQHKVLLKESKKETLKNGKH